MDIISVREHVQDSGEESREAVGHVETRWGDVAESESECLPRAGRSSLVKTLVGNPGCAAYWTFDCWLSYCKFCALVSPLAEWRWWNYFITKLWWWVEDITVLSAQRTLLHVFNVRLPLAFCLLSQPSLKKLNCAVNVKSSKILPGLKKIIKCFRVPLK